MKKIMCSLLVLLLTQIVTAKTALTEEIPTSNFGNHQVLGEIKDLVKKCVIMNLSTNEDHILLRSFDSYCNSLKLNSTSEAQILIDDVWYTAILSESPNADSGDLNDMEVFDSEGLLVASRSNVASFNQIVLAMTGGDQKLQTRIVP